MFTIGYYASEAIGKVLRSLGEASDEKVKVVVDAAAFCFTMYLMSKPIAAYVQHRIEMDKEYIKIAKEQGGLK